GIIAMPLIMIVYKIIEKTKYYESKKYVPLLILYFIFLTLVNHISIVFKKYSKNKYSLLATLIGVVVTIMVMFLSIRRVGVLGVVLAQFSGALTMLITSLIFARKYVKVRINNVKTVLLLLAYILFSTATLMVNWYLSIALFLFTIFVFKDNILDIFKEYKGRKNEESI
ncbi:MAG: polysaccharide biosynthesis C-terminal domain-containing protein, partial [Clostridia bacterium]|nr:polysaccharide biosynthesis C-terminal domain-containing protein [Clostridia bacterium]